MVGIFTPPPFPNKQKRNLRRVFDRGKMGGGGVFRAPFVQSIHGCSHACSDGLYKRASLIFITSLYDGSSTYIAWGSLATLNINILLDK